MHLALLLALSSAHAAPPSACPASTASFAPDPVDPRLQGDALLVVFKAARKIGLYQKGALATIDGAPACLSVALAPDAPTGPKQRQGDRATPEGWYRTSDKPWSQFELAIAIHYPNAQDAAAGLAAGRISASQAAAIRAALAAGHKPPQDTPLGGELLIHGGGSSADWTLGCVALETPELAQLRALLPKTMETDVLLLP
jgi:murein L,D-transpeptidase YafK